MPETTTIDDAEAAFAAFMDALGLEHADDPHLAETPRRVARSRVNELFRGLDEDPTRHLDRTFPTESTDLVIVDNIEVTSMCAHHFLPFTGVAHIGYIPTDRIVGLSKFARLVDGYARRPQVQERLTAQVADAIDTHLDPLATVVVIEAEHECMRLRGVCEPNSVTRTSALRGRASAESHIKEEFFKLAGIAANR